MSSLSSGTPSQDPGDGVLRGDRAALGRAITLIESRAPKHRDRAHAMLNRLLPHSGNAIRLGISGVPGAGKSTFIESFGLMLVEQGHRVAVLTIDPSSKISGGSILGDKTRMAKLAVSEHAFIRPSPTGKTLGGVASRTREAMIVCEAAGFDVILVETVGVGQSETVVADMVDVFLVLTLTGAGDDLQGIKRGILEVVDVLAVNKADGDNLSRAKVARSELQRALHILRSVDTAAWKPQVLLSSGLTGDGLPEVWQTVQDCLATLREAGALAQKRRSQRLTWMWSVIEDEMLYALRHREDVQALLKTLEQDVQDGKTTPSMAADQVLRKAGVL